ncbi:MAG TPA: acetoacetate--CoA ligase [Burkholderiaceae bacterium]|nr:acetoacetate--CoA ligase [Burkholderiaceae bacterium]
MSIAPQMLWTPSPLRIERSRMYDYMRWLEREKSLAFADYHALWQWSVDHLEDFWESIWQYFEVCSSAPYRQVLDAHKMPGAKWFDGAHLNFAEQVFRFHTDDEAGQPAIIAQSELRPLTQLSWRELRQQVGAVAYSLRALGIGPGGRVAAYVASIPAGAVGVFACASIGAIWSSCSPDMGSAGVLDRFRQIDPKLLIAVDGYRYGSKDFDRLPVLEVMRRELPTLAHTVLLPYLNPQATLPDTVLWGRLLQPAVPPQPIRFEQLPFDHPLWILYSSGTTGMPKPIVHGHGGALLETLKGHALQLDLGPEDRFHWYSTTGWIMWNSQVTGLLVGAAICIYDGNPGAPDLGTLWQFAERAGVTFFGAGAAYYANCMKAGIVPNQVADLRRLRSVGSTGSPLPQEAYEWIYANIGRDLLLASISGGTDIAAAFVGACPILPLYSGEMQARGLGIAAYALDEQGQPLDDAVGELVVTEPMPSMPLYFWNDPDGLRYHDSYFDVYPGLWRHGDWIRITPRGGAVIYGRSDTTINRHGIRMGTSEIYRAVEEMPEVLDSLVVDLEYLGRESYMPLFVVLRPGVALDQALMQRIKDNIRNALSARHVPNEIFAVAEIPRTLSGKKMELPIKKLLLGTPIDKIANRDAMSNPDSLNYFVAFARRRQAAAGA